MPLHTHKGCCTCTFSRLTIALQSISYGFFGTSKVDKKKVYQSSCVDRQKKGTMKRQNGVNQRTQSFVCCFHYRCWLYLLHQGVRAYPPRRLQWSAVNGNTIMTQANEAIARITIIKSSMCRTAVDCAKKSQTISTEPKLRCHACANEWPLQWAQESLTQLAYLGAIAACKISESTFKLRILWLTVKCIFKLCHSPATKGRDSTVVLHCF